MAEDPDEKARGASVEAGDGGEISSEFVAGSPAGPAGAPAGTAQTGAGAVAGAPDARPAHRIWVRVVLVLATLLAVLAIFAIWANRQLLDPTNWGRTSTALLQKSSIRSAVSGYLIDQLYANVDVQGELKSGLPKQLAPLAGPISGALHSVAEEGAERALAIPRVQSIWETANRAADQTLVTIVNGGGSRVHIQGGTVALNLHQIVADLADRLGLPASIADKLPASVANLKVFSSSQLGLVRNMAKALHALSVWLTIVRAFALRAGGVSGPWVSAAHPDVGRPESRVRRCLGARCSQARPGSARLGDHHRRFDRTRRQRCLRGGHLAARAGRRAHRSSSASR